MSEFGYFRSIRDNKDYEIKELIVPKASVVRSPVGITNMDIQKAWENHVRLFASTNGRGGKKIRMPHIQNKLYCRFYLHDALITIEYEVDFVGTGAYLKAIMVSDSLDGHICSD